MDRVQLEVITIGEGVSSVNTAYNVLLKEKYGTRKMVIVISYVEAQSIAISLNNTIANKRVMTHDLFYKVCKTFNVEMLEINIHSLNEGIYATTASFKKNDLIETFDARVSDSIALALKYNCPIYIKSKLLDTVAFGEKDKDETRDKDSSENELSKEIEDIESITMADIENSSFKKNTLSELKEMLEIALQDENYELAAKLRDEIEKRS